MSEIKMALSALRCLAVVCADDTDALEIGNAAPGCVVLDAWRGRSRTRGEVDRGWSGCLNLDEVFAVLLVGAWPGHGRRSTAWVSSTSSAALGGTRTPSQIRSYKKLKGQGPIFMAVRVQG